MADDTTPRVRHHAPLTLFDNLKDAGLTFSYSEKENSIVIVAARDGSRPYKYTITKPTVEKLRRWLSATITHM